MTRITPGANTSLGLRGCLIGTAAASVIGSPKEQSGERSPHGVERGIDLRGRKPEGRGQPVQNVTLDLAHSIGYVRQKTCDSEHLTLVLGFGDVFAKDAYPMVKPIFLELVVEIGKQIFPLVGLDRPAAGLDHDLLESTTLDIVEHAVRGR